MMNNGIVDIRIREVEWYVKLGLKLARMDVFVIENLVKTRPAV